MPKRSYFHVVRRGLIQVKVRVETRKAGIHYSLSISRLYRNGDQWKESKRYGRDDIPVVRLALDDAYGWILLQQSGISADSDGLSIGDF